MTLPVTVAAAMFVGVIAYAVLGGAEFGSSFYDFAAWPGEHGPQTHSLIDDRLGPVWEDNHVWVIYVLVMWWTAFPGAFAAAMTTLLLPLALALTGIVLRGASFAFRKNAATFGQAQLTSRRSRRPPVRMPRCSRCWWSSGSPSWSCCRRWATYCGSLSVAPAPAPLRRTE
jgi:hypothetical protein